MKIFISNYRDWLSFLTLLLLIIPVDLKAQVKKEDSIQNIESLYAELDAIFGEESDSTLLLFALVDSLLSTEEEKYHSLIFRSAYLGQVSSAGRIQDFNQSGYSLGVSYFHHSNVFVDFSSFWNTGYEPAYYLSTFSLGYLKSYGKYWSSSLNHDFYIYNDTTSSNFNKSLQFGQYLDYKWLNLGLDYSILYGNSFAHRLMLSLSLEKEWKFKSWLNRLRIAPGANVTAGNADIVYVRQSDTPFYDMLQLLRQDSYPQLERKEYIYLAGLLYNERYTAAGIFLREKGFTRNQINQFVNAYYDQIINEDNVFGVMNYSFNLPVQLQFGRLNCMLNYTYNIPVSLPNESINYEPNGFLSISLSYMLYWK